MSHRNYTRENKARLTPLIFYVQVDADTLIVDGNIIVEGYIAGNGALGITMEDPAVEADIPIMTGNDQDNFISTAVYNKDPEDDFVLEAKSVDDDSHPASLLGSAAANILEGGSGSDTLSGGAGNDRLYAAANDASYGNSLDRRTA